MPDIFKLRDADGTAILCHSCHRSAADNRPVIPCSQCGLFWHLDCLDPPLANPPVLRTWKCPAHADDLLVQLPSALYPAHRFRRVKGDKGVRPAFSRGLVNNGFIEVDDDGESDDESGWQDVKSFGHVYRLPSAGIMLDFFSRYAALALSVYMC